MIWHIEGIKTYWGYSGTTEIYWAIFIHIQNPGIFRTQCIFKSLSNIYDNQGYSEPWHSQNSLLKYFQRSLKIFRDTDAYLPELRHYSFCKVLHLKCLTVFCIQLCFENYSVIFTVALCYILHQTNSEFWHIHNLFT